MLRHNGDSDGDACQLAWRGWWLVAGGWWLVAGGWWLVAGGWWLVAGGWWFVACGVWRVVCGLWLIFAHILSTYPKLAEQGFGVCPCIAT